MRLQHKVKCVAILLILLIPIQPARSESPKKLLVYYGNLSTFNGSENMDQVIQMFNRYDIIILGEGLEYENHPEHLNALKLIKNSKAIFYGYVTMKHSIENVLDQMDRWSMMGARGIFLDGVSGSTAVLSRAIEHARSRGMEVTLNLSNSSAFKGVLPRGVNIALEFSGNSENIPDFPMPQGGIWCLIRTATRSFYESRIAGYDILTHIYPYCHAISIQEDYFGNNKSFYAFPETSNFNLSFKGVNLVLWGEIKDKWLENTLRKLKNIGFNSILFTLYLKMDSPNSSSIRTFEYTPKDDEIKLAVSKAREMGFKVFLRLSIYLDSGWGGDIMPLNLSSWLKSYKSYIIHYSSLAEVDGFVLGTELCSIDKRGEFRELVKEIRRSYSGRLGYSANWGSEATSFWDLLDFIGIDAYYPINGNNTWDFVHKMRIEPLLLLYGKPIIFTEIGYRSMRGAHEKPWDWKSKSEVDYEEQSYLWSLFLEKEAFRIYGFFHWAEAPWGEDGTGYSIIGKPAEDAIRLGLKKLPLISALSFPTYYAPSKADEESLEELYPDAKLCTDGNIVVGGPFVNPKSKELKISGVSFGKDELKVNQSIYRSIWKKIDYALVVFREGKIYLMGVHRFGTKAALLWLSEKPYFTTAVIRWRDMNGDGDVETGEIEVLMKI